MTEAETAVREALAKMTLGAVFADGCAIRKAHPTPEEMRIFAMCATADDAAGIVALKNHTPALLAELDAARAEVEQLREAVLLRREVLRKGAPVEQELLDANDALEAAVRAALEGAHP